MWITSAMIKLDCIVRTREPLPLSQSRSRMKFSPAPAIDVRQPFKKDAITTNYHIELLIKYQELINSIFLLAAIIILLIVLGANNSPSAFLNYLKYILIIFFLIGGGLIGINAFRNFKEKAKGL